MSRTVNAVLASGYLTEVEAKAIEFAQALEENEDLMAENAAMAVTCEQHNLRDTSAGYGLLLELPDGEWWRADSLPVKK